MHTIETITGTKVIGEIKPGSELVRYGDFLIVIIHPDDPPKYIDILDMDAGIQELTFQR